MCLRKRSAVCNVSSNVSFVVNIEALDNPNDLKADDVGVWVFPTFHGGMLQIPHDVKAKLNDMQKIFLNCCFGIQLRLFNLMFHLSIYLSSFHLIIRIFDYSQ